MRKRTPQARYPVVRHLRIYKIEIAKLVQRLEMDKPRIRNEGA